MAKAARTEWLIFSDLDTVYDDDLFERILAAGHPFVAGRSRRDVVDMATGQPINDFYRCGFAPMVIKKALFESVGGFCTQYEGYGFEDSDFENKLPPALDFDSRGYHDMSVHSLMDKNNWRNDTEHNRKLFEVRLKMSVEDRIRADVAAYSA